MTTAAATHDAAAVGSLIVELDALRTVLVDAGERRAIIRRLDDTIDYLRHLHAGRSGHEPHQPAEAP